MRVPVWLCVVLVASAQAAFTPDGQMMAGTALSGWGQPGASGLHDGADNETGHRDLVRFWLAWITQDGGDAPPSPENPLTGLAIRFDHAGDTPDSENWNLQLNLGDAGPGKVDHLLKVRPVGADAALVRLDQYDAPYPAIGPFTTIRTTEVFSNDPESTKHHPGVQARSGAWASGHGLEVLLPIAWVEQAPASHVAADGSGTSLVWGTVFGSTGTFGAVGTVKDTLDDGDPLVVSTDVSTGATTAQPISATRLVFLDAPADVTAGTQLDDLRVEVQDAAGARVGGATHEILMRLGSDPSDGVAGLAGTLRAQAVDGVATFTDLAIDTAGSAYTLEAVAANLVTGVSAAFDVLAPPEVSVDASPVDGGGSAQEARWGAWGADPGAAGVLSANYLKVTNTGAVDATRFTLSFSSPSMAGATDPAWTIPLQGNIRFACAETLTGEPPAELSFTMGPASASASTTCTFSAGSADGVGVMYVQYELLELPDVLPDQDYAAAFTVEVG